MTSLFVPGLYKTLQTTTTTIMTTTTKHQQEWHHPHIQVRRGDLIECLDGIALSNSLHHEEVPRGSVLMVIDIVPTDDMRFHCKVLWREQDWSLLLGYDINTRFPRLFRRIPCAV